MEMASFTPLVFSTFGGISGATKVFYKRLADLLSVKKSMDYSTVMSWLRCRQDLQLTVFGEHDPAVVVWPIMVRLTLLWPKVKCVVVCRCISVPFLLASTVNISC